MKTFGKNLQHIAKYGMLTLTAELGLIGRYRAGREDLLLLSPKIPHTKDKSKKKGVKEMTKTANEEWEIPSRQKVVRGSYSVNASACVSMLNKYYDARKDGKIVDTVRLKEPYTVIGSHAFTNCHVKELTIPDTVTQLNRFAFADSKTLKKITLGKGIEKCGEDLILR